MVEESMRELGAETEWVEPKQVIRKVRKNYEKEDVNKGTIRSQLMYNSINQPSRLHSPSPEWKNRPLFKYNNRGGYKLLSDEEEDLFKRALRLDKPVIEKKFYTVEELKNSLSEKETEMVPSELEGKEETKERVRASISLERDLHEFIVSRLDSLEEGLRLYEGGSEFATDAGRIDVFAVDKEENLVVIEIKTGKARDSAVGQILRYIGFVESEIADQDQDVRAIIIADEFDDNLKYSVKRMPEIELKEYRVSFDFEDKRFQ